MTDLSQACADLMAWLPAIAALTAVPDTTITPGRRQPVSAPPWNAAAAMTMMDIHAGVRALERDLRLAVTGSALERGGSTLNTFRAIEAVGRLADGTAAADAVAIIDGWVTAIMTLPAIDLEERVRRLRVPCPRCGRRMLRLAERSGRVACLGCAARGQLRPGTVSNGIIEWADGVIT